MRLLSTSASICLLIALLAACGSDEKTTIVHERPVVIQQAPGAAVMPADVERQCAHGYDNRTRSCY